MIGVCAEQEQELQQDGSTPTWRSRSPRLGNFASVVKALFDERETASQGGRDFSAPEATASAAVGFPEQSGLDATASFSCGQDDFGALGAVFDARPDQVGDLFPSRLGGKKPCHGSDSASTFEPELLLGGSPVRFEFVPREFVDDIDFVSTSPSTKVSSPVNSRSSSPPAATFSTPASTPPSVVGAGLTGPSIVTTKISDTYFALEDIFGTNAAVDGHYELPASLVASYKQVLAEAEQLVVDSEFHLPRILALNYSIVDQGLSCGAQKFPGFPTFSNGQNSHWFCPIPLGPLSYPVNVNPSDYYRSGVPLFSPKVVNPVYLSTRQAKYNLIVARLGLECTKDALLQTTRCGVSPEGVHVFVDMSNIIIGFYNHLKRHRGIPTHKKVIAPPFFFQGLSLILERGRTAAKRVVAGSTVDPHDRSNWPQYMKDAELLGYEMNILSRVSKPQVSSPLARRSRRHRRPTLAAQNGGGGFTAFSGTTSSDDDAHAFAQPYLLKNGEQAVDEILHLKMCESILDYERSTIVLATGDAAAAEFSDGFLAMAERALTKGWHVELVTWKSTISSSWHRLVTGKWKDQFRIVPLDWYVEELFDSS